MHAGGVLLLGGEADAEQEVAATALPDPLDDLLQEPSPVLERAAVLVVPAVGVRREELGDEVAVRSVDLDAVVAEVAQVDRALDERLDQLFDLVVRERVGYRRSPLRAEGGGRDQRVVGFAADVLAAEVDELRRDQRAMLVDELGPPLEVAEGGRVVELVQPAVEEPGGRTDDRTADCDQRRTALGPALPVREVLVVGDPELDVGGAVGQSDHPVAKPQPAELELAEQELVRGPVLGHRGSQRLPHPPRRAGQQRPCRGELLRRHAARHGERRGRIGDRLRQGSARPAQGKPDRLLREPAHRRRA